MLNQQPQVGASALESGQVQALSQFVAWPGLLVFQDKAKLLYDGAELNYPTFHGVVVRKRLRRPSTPRCSTRSCRPSSTPPTSSTSNPLEAAEIVAEGSGLPQEVVYLYNGPGGTIFDTTLKPSLVEALKGDVPYLKSIGDFADLDVDGFVDDAALRKAFAARGQDYDTALAVDGEPVRARAAPTRCATSRSPIPALAGELWLDGADATQPAANPDCLLRPFARPTAEGEQVRAAYVPDAELGTRWFADKSVWVQDGAATTCRSARRAGAQRYIAAHPGSDGRSTTSRR